MNTSQLAYDITKAIGYTENGGKPNLQNPSQGKTGELASIFQYEPPTWDTYAQQVTGKSGVPLTPDNEVSITMQKIQQWLNQGLTPEQIFSSWNAGPGEPNAYTGKFSNGQPSVGVNKKYGIKYNVPAYVDTAMKYFNQFNQTQPSLPQDNNPPVQAQLTNTQPPNPPSSPQPYSNPGLLATSPSPKIPTSGVLTPT